MKIDKSNIASYNENEKRDHIEKFDFLNSQLNRLEIDTNDVVKKLQDFQVAIPSWALGAGGTRFGRFSYGGEPSNLEQKIDDVGIIQALTQSAGAISLHIPWDIPEDAEAIKQQVMLAEGCGEKAFTLVDLGHHLPNTNIEQIVAILMMKGKLGGFHFNDSKYGDDDLTCGSIKPYQLFLIFNELVDGMDNNEGGNPPLAWMIDASHNIKDPLEDLIQSLEAIRIAYAQALLIDRKALDIARQESDVVRCQEILQTAYRTDVRPLLAEARRLSGGAIDPIGFYRKMNVRKNLVSERGMHSIASGL